MDILGVSLGELEQFIHPTVTPRKHIKGIIDKFTLISEAPKEQVSEMILQKDGEGLMIVAELD